jgi:hypothetical protein
VYVVEDPLDIGVCCGPISSFGLHVAGR